MKASSLPPVVWCCACGLVIQLCLTLCNSMDCSLPGSSVHGILQARILEWVAVLFSRGSSWSKDWITTGFFIYSMRKFSSSWLLSVSFKSWKDAEFFSNAFEASLKWWCRFPLIPLMWYIILIYFHTLNYSGIPRINPTWSQCVILLVWYWIQFSLNLFKLWFLL